MGELSQEEVEAYAVRGVSIRLASRTHVGLVRRNNEDSVVLGDLARPSSSLRSGRIGRAGVLFGVCDGMGGAAAGEVASAMAAEAIVRALARTSRRLAPEGFRRALASAVVHAGATIQRHVAENPACSGMGTTCTVAAVRGGLLVLVQVGDSRAYLMRGGELRQLTTDQTWANEMLARGHVTPEEAAAMENGKSITQALGPSQGLQVELVHLALRHGDRLLICSDGLSGMVAGTDIARVTASVIDLEEASDELLHLALEAGGRDNVSFVLCEFLGKGLAGVAHDRASIPMKWGRKTAFTVVFGLLAACVLTWQLHRSGEPAPRAAGASKAAHAIVQRQQIRPKVKRVTRPSGEDRQAISNGVALQTTIALDGLEAPPSKKRTQKVRKGREVMVVDRPREERIQIIRDGRASERGQK